MISKEIKQGAGENRKGCDFFEEGRKIIACVREKRILRMRKFDRSDHMYIKSSWPAMAPGGKKDISRSGESQRVGWAS